MRFACWITKATDTLEKSNTYSFSTTTIIYRSRFNVTLIRTLSVFLNFTTTTTTTTRPRQDKGNFGLKWAAVLRVPTALYYVQLVQLHLNARSRNGVVGIGIRYGLEGPGIESLLGARLSAPIHTGSEAHPASCTMGTGSFPVARRPGRGLTTHPHLVPRSSWPIEMVKPKLNYFPLTVYGAPFDPAECPPKCTSLGCKHSDNLFINRLMMPSVTQTVQRQIG